MATTVNYTGITFDCQAPNPKGNPSGFDAYKGVIYFVSTLDGDYITPVVFADPIEIGLSLSWAGEVRDLAIPTLPIVVTMGIIFDTDFFISLEYPQNNWVWWSKIGEMTFEEDRSNEAGKRPMEWSGDVYDIRKFDDHVIVYGAGGISKLKASGVNWGLKTIFKVGIKSKLASTGTELLHWFVDATGDLWSYDGQFKLHGWKEYLDPLGDVVLNYDAAEKLLYICDGTSGYVYSVENDSLCAGPINVAGIHYKDNVTYITAPAAIEIPLFALCTDIYDMGTRKEKTIFNIEVGTNVDVILQAAVDFRVHRENIFTSLPWVPVTTRGIAYIPCYGVEFKFRLRALTYAYFELDYMKVNGVIQGYSFLDTVE
jgi:hypothetical protein